MQIDELETKIAELLKDELPEIDFSRSATMAQDGLLDSLAMTKIISALVMEFDVVIPYEQIKRQNFDSPRAMAGLVSSLMN